MEIMEFIITNGNNVEGVISSIYDNEGIGRLTISGIKLNISLLKKKAFEQYDKALIDGKIINPLSAHLTKITLYTPFSLSPISNPGYKFIMANCEINYKGVSDLFIASIPITIEELAEWLLK